MKLFKNIFILTVFMSLVSIKLAYSQIPSDLANSFKTGNSTAIAKHFGATVELTIANSEDVFSNVQAELIIKDFFKKNPVTDFKFIHEGGKPESKYAIGSLKTQSGNYRVTILFKSTNNKSYIHQLSIGKDDI